MTAPTAWFGKFSWKQFTFGVGVSNRGKGIPTAPFGTQFNNPETRFIDQQAFFDLRYLDEIADHLELSGHVFHGRYDFTGHYVFDSPLPITQNVERAKGYWWGTEIKFVSTQFEQHKIVLGGEYQDNVYNLFNEHYSIVAGQEYAMSTIPQNGTNYRIVFSFKY